MSLSAFVSPSVRKQPNAISLEIDICSTQYLLGIRYTQGLKLDLAIVPRNPESQNPENMFY